MEVTFNARLKQAWNIFRNRDPTVNTYEYGQGYSYRPDRVRLTGVNERSIVTSVYNRIALDVAGIALRHCYVDEDDQFVSLVDSGLNNCLSLGANTDQTARAFVQDVVMSMLDEGSVAIVPIDTVTNLKKPSEIDILTLRVGKIMEWYPSKVRLRVYNEETGRKQDIVMPKSKVAIIENPLYAVINEPNSTMKRLAHKLSLLDVTDEQTASGKLDLIIQLPYVIRSDAKKQAAESRRKDIEMQLAGSKYGIAYTDGTEKITQLNRSLENNLMKQIEFLTSLVFSQLGMTQSILDGTANEQTLLNYYDRSIEPIVSAIVDEMKRKFLSDDARKEMQTIKAFRDPFKLVPINNIADIADKFTRNEIMTSNEIRQKIGMRPSSDPKADKLQNSNINYGEGTGDSPGDSSYEQTTSDQQSQQQT